MKKLSIIFMLVLISVSLFAGGGGGGGTFFGYQTTQYPFLQENYDIPNNNLGLTYFGGYGYGVNRDGVISGGFGMALLDPVQNRGISGGFGGVINGLQIIDWSALHLNIISYTGFGGMYTGSIPHPGFFAISEEITAELGIAIFSWFMPTVYVGYQVIGNVIPGELFNSFLSYTPTIGVRIAWGSF